MLPQQEVNQLIDAATDAFDGVELTTPNRLKIAGEVVELLDKIKEGEATTDELNDYRQIINNFTGTNTILSKDAFRGDSAVAAEMSLESMSNTFDNFVEGVARFLRKLWQFVVDLFMRLKGMISKLIMNLKGKKAEVAKKKYTNDVPDVAENYIVIKDNAASASLYNKGERAYTTDLTTTARTMKTLFDRCFMEMLKSEIASANAITELSEVAIQAIARGDRESARNTVAQMDVMYAEQSKKMDDLLRPYIGTYVGGLEVTSGLEGIRFKVSPVTPPSEPFRIKALGGAELEQLLEIGVSVTEELKNITDGKYKELKRIIDENSKNIEEYVNGRQMAKNKQDRLKQKDYEVLQVMVNKAPMHFQRITNTLASVMNTISRFAWTIEASIYPENKRILENLLTGKTGKVSMEDEQQPSAEDEMKAAVQKGYVKLPAKVKNIITEVERELARVNQESSVNVEHYRKTIDRCRQMVLTEKPNYTFNIMDHAAFSYDGAWDSNAIIKGTEALAEYIREMETAIVSDNIESFVENLHNAMFIGGGITNGVLFKAVAADASERNVGYSSTDVLGVLKAFEDTLGYVKQTLISYLPKVVALLAKANSADQELAAEENPTLAKLSVIVRRITGDRNVLLSGLNVLAINDYLYSAIDEFTESCFRAMYD